MIFEDLKKISVGSEVYVVKPILIRWSSMRFENTNIIFATYILEEKIRKNFLNGNDCIFHQLKSIEKPKGTLNYPDIIYSNGSSNFKFFLTKEEAEIWKVIELQSLENQVEEYIKEMRKKTLKKIKSLKRKEKLNSYLEKYPEKVLKVL